MAKIKLGALAQDARGSLAGTTFSRNRGGSYVRQKTSPVQPRTERQLAQRAIFTAASQGWRTIEPEQRAAWGNWATNHPISNVFGDAQVLSGIAAYTRIQSVLQTAGLPMDADPPADVAIGALPTSAPAVGSTGVVTVTFTDNPGINDVYLVFTTQGRSPGVAFVNSDYRLAGIITGAASTLTYAVTPTDLNSRLIYSAGQTIGVLVACVGQNGVYQPTTAFVDVAS